MFDFRCQVIVADPTHVSTPKSIQQVGQSGFPLLHDGISNSLSTRIGVPHIANMRRPTPPTVGRFVDGVVREILSLLPSAAHLAKEHRSCFPPLCVVLEELILVLERHRLGRDHGLEALEARRQIGFDWVVSCFDVIFLHTPLGDFVSTIDTWINSSASQRVELFQM